MDTKTDTVTPQEWAATLREASPWAREVIERAIAEGRMTESEARAILGDTIKPDGSLYRLDCGFVSWHPGDKLVELDQSGAGGGFTAAELQAIAWWMQRQA